MIQIGSKEGEDNDKDPRKNWRDGGGEKEVAERGGHQRAHTQMITRISETLTYYSL